MKNLLTEIEKELKRLKLLNKERTLNGICDLPLFLIQDSHAKTFHMMSYDMEEEKEYLRIEHFFKNNESVEIKKFNSENNALEIELEVNGQTFKRVCNEDEVYSDFHPFFELLVEMNAALNGRFLSVPHLGAYVFCGIYIEESKEAKRLEELFSLYAVSARETPQLTINVYPSKAQNSKLQDADFELLKENIPQSTSINHSIISPDKQKFIMACADENIYIWNKKEKSLERKLVGHSDHVNVLAHHPRKDVLVSGACSVDSTLKIWDSKNYKLLKTIGEQGDENTNVDDPKNKSYYRLEFIDGGNYLVAIYVNPEDEHTLEIFESENFTLVQTTALRFKVDLFSASLNGGLLAFYNDRYETTIQILSFKNNTIKAYKEFFAHIPEFSKLFFSEDNRYLCEYDSQNNCKNLWEIEKESFSVKKHKGYIDQSQVSLAFCMLSKENLFAIQYRYKIVVWDSTTKKIKLEIKEDSHNYQSINFSQDALYLIKYYDETQKVWSIESGELLEEENEIDEIVSTASNSSFLLKNLDRIAMNDSASSMVFLQELYDSQTDTLSRNLIFFNREKKELKRLFIDDLVDTDGIYFIGNEKYICVTQNNALRIFEAESQREIIADEYRELLEKKLMFNITKIEEIVDESRAIKKEEDEYLFFTKELYAQAFNPKGNILTVGTEKGIEFWDIEAKNFVMSWEISDGTYLNHAGELSYIDENHLLVTLNAGLFIITVDKQEIKHCFPNVDAFALHQEKQLLAFSQRDENRVVLFSLAENKVLEILHLSDSLDSLAFNHDATLLTGSQINHYLSVWESPTLKKVYRESSEQTAYCDNFSKLMFTNDGEELIAINSWHNEIEVRQVNAFFSWRKWAIVKEFDAIAIAINPKIKEFAIACNEKEQLAFLNHKFKKQKSLPLDPSELRSNALLYSPDGKYLSVIDSKGFVKLFSTKKRELESILVAGREGEWLTVNDDVIESSSSLTFLNINNGEKNE